MQPFTLRVLPCLDNDLITYDVLVVNHPDFADSGDDYLTAVVRTVQRIVTEHPRCQLSIEAVEDFAPYLLAIQARARERLESQPAADVLSACIAELRAAGADHLVRHLEERRDQLNETWQVRMAMNTLAHTAALMEPPKQG